MVQLPRPRAERIAAPREAYRFQREAARRLYAERRHMINFEMGLGKSLTAIIAIRGAWCSSVVIVCPANVRLVWQDQLDQWWSRHPAIGLLDKGAKADDESPILIVSYELLPLLLRRRHRFDAVIIDEGHYISRAQTERGQAVRKRSGEPQRTRGIAYGDADHK